MFKFSALFLLTISIFSMTGIMLALPAVAQDTTQRIAPDNSRVNIRDRSSDEPTSDEGGQTMSDREIMQRIRKEVIADTSLSTYAHNVKIISQNGKVTLKGVVRSDDEKQNVTAKAVDVVGDDNVINKLSIKSTN